MELIQNLILPDFVMVKNVISHIEATTMLCRKPLHTDVENFMSQRLCYRYFKSSRRA